MSFDQISAEQEATQGLVKLLEQARRCQLLYERAQMAFPEPLKRLLSMNGTAATVTTAHPDRLTIPAPQAPPAPTGAKSDWLWIPQETATPTAITLAILKAAKAPLPAREVVAKVLDILPEVPRGSVNNIGTRLNGKQIYRTDNGWQLINPDGTGILHEGYLWGPREFFHKYELAVHRRAAILHVLSFFQGGLQPRQILDQLRKCSWVHAPVNKDLLKADFEILDQDEKIRRVGNSGKWELAPAKEPMKLNT
jgi:hypothetical protein